MNQSTLQKTCLRMIIMENINSETSRIFYLTKIWTSKKWKKFSTPWTLIRIMKWMILNGWYFTSTFWANSKRQMTTTILRLNLTRCLKWFKKMMNSDISKINFKMKMMLIKCYIIWIRTLWIFMAIFIWPDWIMLGTLVLMANI